MKSWRIEIKWAIIFIIMMLLWMLMEKLAGFHDVRIDKHYIISMFVLVPAIAVYVFALRDKRKNFYGGRMTWTQGFTTGIVITLFITALTPLLQYIISTYITPDFFANISRFTIEQKILTPEAAAETFNLKSYMIQATLGALIMGIAISAIVALFTRKK